MSRLLRALPFALVLAMTACAGASSINQCPPWPVAGPNVAAELETIPFEGYEHFWNWMARLDKLRDQLAVCQ